MPAVEPVLSLAGRTQNPVLPAVPCRIGGFGGASGMAAYLQQESIEMVIDATHPFAENISANAEAACRETGVRLVVFTRPPWKPEKGDRWTEVPDAASAAAAIGAEPRRVFLTVGRLQLPAFEAAPQHDYLIRTIDPPNPPPNLPSYRLIMARGPFTLIDELQLLRSEGMRVLVTKNSGGNAARAKIDAARVLKMDVILMRQPSRGAVRALHNLDAVVAAIQEKPRGV